MAGCGTGSGENQTGDSTQSAQAIDESEGKTLVVYYSTTGNTERVANMIAEAAGADLFKLEPMEPYTDTDLDWTDDNSRVVESMIVRTSGKWNCFQLQ